MAGLLAMTAAGLGVGRQAPAAAAVRPCSNGLVALTFDDGPSTDVTPKLLRVLTDRRVPATFFVVGSRVASAKSIALAAYEQGFVIANHSYGHESLPSLSDDGIRSTLRRTTHVLRDAGVRPSSLMRPPYGAIDARVTSVVEGMGLKPVLWDVDSRNWEPATAAGLTSRVLSALRPHGRNIVLLHDGVTRSATTLAAVPGIVRGARARGYCFAELGPSGVPVPPVPRLRVSDARVEEADPGTGVRLTFTLTLDRPTSRPVSVRVRTAGGTASDATDFRAVRQRIDVPSGTTRRPVTVRVRGDRIDERREGLRLLLDRPRGLVLDDRVGRGTIVDDDPPPRVSLSDATVTEPTEGSVGATVGVLLDRTRSRRVAVVVRARPVTAAEDDYVATRQRLVLPAGERRGEVVVEVLADGVDEVEEVLEVVVESVRGGRVADGTAVVTISPPGTRTDG